MSHIKLRTFLVSLGIIISVTMITGINVASNQMGTYEIVQHVDRVKNDFSFQQSGSLIEPGVPETYTQDLAKLEELESELDEYLLSYASNFLQEENLLIQNSDQEVNWEEILSLPYGVKSDYLPSVNLYSFGENIFTHPEVSKRFSDLMSSNAPLDFSKPGIYVDIHMANAKNLTIGTNVSMGVYRQINYYDENIDRWVLKNFTSTIPDIPVLGVFKMMDEYAFMKSFGGYTFYGARIPRFILGNLTYMEEELISPMRTDLKEQMEIYDKEPELFETNGFRYHILLNHTPIVQRNPNMINKNVDYIESRIKLKFNDETYGIQSSLKSAVLSVRTQILIFQGLYIIVSTPILILGGFLYKKNWILSYPSKRREMARLKIQSESQNQLKTMFMYEALINGLVGGVIGVIGGNFSASIVLNQVYPDAVAYFSTGQIIHQLLTGEYMSISTWLIGIVVGLGISIFTVRKPLKQVIKLDFPENLQKYNESQHTRLEKRRMDVILFILGSIPILIALVTQGYFEIYQDFSFYMFPMRIIMIFSAPLLPFAPFMVIYAVIRLLCRNEMLFKGFVKRISSVFDEKISVFAQKSIIRNRARSFRLIYIMAMTLSFMVIATTIEGIETEYQDQIYSLDTGNGIPISIDFWDNLQPNVPSMISQFENNEEEYGLRDFTYAYQFSNSRVTEKASNYNSLVAIDVDGFRENIELRDCWFVDITAEDALNKLETIPNSTLVPYEFFMGNDKEYRMNDPISVRYYDQEAQDYAEIVLTIVGIYEVFPLVQNQWYYNRPVLVNTGTLNASNTKVANMIITFYDDLDDDFTVTSDQLITAIEANYAFTGYVADTSTISRDETINLVSSSLLRYLNLQSFYLLIIVGFIVGILIYISIKEKSQDISLLHARTVPRRLIYKIQMAEGLTLLTMSTIFISLGLLSGLTIILYLNNIVPLLTNRIKRFHMIPWGQIGLQVLGALLFFMGCIASTVAIEMRKTEMDAPITMK